MARTRVTRRQRERKRHGEYGDGCWLCLPGKTKRRELRERIDRRELAAARRSAVTPRP